MATAVKGMNINSTSLSDKAFPETNMKLTRLKKEKETYIILKHFHHLMGSKRMKV